MREAGDYANVTINPGLELISRTLDRCLRRLDEQLALPQREPQRRATLSVVRSKDT
jgi:hypothetical protein